MKTWAASLFICFFALLTASVIYQYSIIILYQQFTHCYLVIIRRKLGLAFFRVEPGDSVEFTITTRPTVWPHFGRITYIFRNSIWAFPSHVPM
ncbi:hypothetical protein C8J57DRAFT_1328287 [Mycena rebaudengoi]|nr:hypothetical protein C8J57DRAFT_1328287 [Mycena rebaudengoi]